MMPEDTMRLFRDQMEAWMNLMTPAAMQGPAEAQKAWEGFFRQQLELWASASEHARAQMEQMMQPFLQQMEATQAASREMQRLARWFTDEAATTFTAMRDYYKLLADIEEQLAKLHRMAAEQVERMQAGLPHFPQGKES